MPRNRSRRPPGAEGDDQTPAPDTALNDIAERLYALPPEDFTAARTDAAKQAGATHAGGTALRDAVTALRRHTVAAHLVNRLARERPDLLEQLLALGPALAEAQKAGSAADLRTLGQQRRQLVEAVTSAAVEQADRSVPGAARTEVVATLEAALADPASADAVRSGRLVRALSFAGFGGVDLDGAVATPPLRASAGPAGSRTSTNRSGASRRKPTGEDSGSSTKGGSTKGGGRSAPAGSGGGTSPRAERDTAKAEAAALDAAAALDDAVRACEVAERARASADEAMTQAEQDHQDARAAVERLGRELSAAEERSTAASRTARGARTASGRAAKQADVAVTAVREAQQRAEQTRAALDALRRHST